MDALRRVTGKRSSSDNTGEGTGRSAAPKEVRNRQPAAARGGSAWGLERTPGSARPPTLQRRRPALPRCRPPPTAPNTLCCALCWI